MRSCLMGEGACAHRLSCAAQPSLKVVGFSSLFPNAAFPAHGIFLKHRLGHLAALEDVELRVVAPVPWFPSSRAMFGRFAAFARVPPEDGSRTLPVLHPRYPVIPKLGMSLAPVLMATATAPVLARLRRGGFDFDVIDAYYLYPDGVAAALLGALFDRPVVLTAFGSDVSLIPRWAVPRAQILWALRRAAGLTAVCNALRDGMEALGVQAERVRVVRHGVDLNLFRPLADRDAARAALGIGSSPTLISVGHLIPRKGHDIAIAALHDLPEVHLMIVGTGPEEQVLRVQAKAQGVDNRVTFLGTVPQEALCRLLGAADALILCSDREGIANVLLEAMACGTPVLATSVWGTPEVVDQPAAGLLMRDRTPAAVVEAVRALLAAPPPREATRRFAEQFQWTATARQHAAILRDGVRDRCPHRRATAQDLSRMGESG